MINFKKQSEINKALLTLAKSLFFIFSTFAIISGNAYGKEIHAVLVTSKSSTINKLERKDIRRLFLGLQPTNSNQINKPVLNLKNKEVYKLFLKNVMFLTESGYKRKLVKRVFRQGADEIKSIDTHKELLEYLNEHPDNISFMLEKDAKKQSDLKIIQALW